ncbi:MAG: hypothetical protein ACJ707_05835, partial [Nitrososphaera sp.]
GTVNSIGDTSTAKHILNFLIRVVVAQTEFRQNSGLQSISLCIVYFKATLSCTDMQTDGDYNKVCFIY